MQGECGLKLHFYAVKKMLISEHRADLEDGKGDDSQQ